MLPHVVRFNAADTATAARYRELAAVAGVAEDRLALEMEALLNLAGLPATLHAAGVERACLPDLAEEAARQWTATFNPRKLAAADFAELYAAAFG